jgi:hypothetical protein
MKLRRSTQSRCAVRMRRTALPAAALLILAGCGEFGQAMTAHTDVVARAAGRELRVAEAAELLASNPQIPADPQVARALADIWVDYMLLGRAVSEDPELGMLDMDAFIRPMREQEIMARLRDQVIQVDTTFTEEQLQAAWRTEGPGAEIRARHILLRVPAEATPAQRDSVQQLAAALRGRAQGGESFAQLAEQYSQDPGSAARGGDLGFFGRGRMVPSFDEAAFALEPGQTSEVVESPFGYHVIRVEERRQPQLTEEREPFREFLVQRRVQEAEGAYLDSLTAAVGVQVRPGGLAVVREIASRPEVTLRGRAADREIATYRGGAYTTGEFAEFIRAQPPQTQSAFATATDEQLESAVQQLTRTEILMADARARNITLPAEDEERLRRETRQQIRELLEATGLLAVAGQPQAAVDQHVRRLIAEGVAGRAQLVPLGRLGFALRDRYPAEINEGTFSQVVSQLEQIRASQPAPAPQQPQGLPLPEGELLPEG